MPITTANNVIFLSNDSFKVKRLVSNKKNTATIEYNTKESHY